MDFCIFSIQIKFPYARAFFFTAREHYFYNGRAKKGTQSAQLPPCPVATTVATSASHHRGGQRAATTVAGLIKSTPLIVPPFASLLLVQDLFSS